jgi:endonuclease/exonuclease/phosphatase family metal-dependent hydrolase
MRALWTLVVVLPLSAGAVAPDASAKSDEGKKVTFMSRNLYLGADLAPAIVAIMSGDEAAIVTSVGEVWQGVKSTDFPTRAAAIADEIKSEKPDFVGLQEAVTWTVGPPVPGMAPTTVVYDFVEILRDALEARGMHYDVVASVDDFGAFAPGVAPESPYVVDGVPLFNIGIQDHDVLLVRRGGDFKISNAGGHTYTDNMAYPSPFGPIADTRGWVQADVTMGQRKFRVVTTHLEADVEAYRNLQAAELVATPCDTDLPVVLLGDFNSNGNSPDDTGTGAAYQIVRDAEFEDAWLLERPDDPGITYGQEPTLTVASFPSTLTEPIERIDFVLFRGGIGSESADRFGCEVADMYEGLWPSDHAGVVATLRVR